MYLSKYSIGLFFPEFGGHIWDPSLMGLGASMIKYDPDEPESPRNQISVSTGPITVVEWGGEGSSSQDAQTEAIVSIATSGTSSSATGGKTENGGSTVTYTHMVDPTYNRNEDLYVANKLNVDASSVSSAATLQSIYGEGSYNSGTSGTNRYVTEVVDRVIESYYMITGTPMGRIMISGLAGGTAGFGYGKRYGLYGGIAFGLAGSGLGLTIGGLNEDNGFNIPITKNQIRMLIGERIYEEIDIDIKEYIQSGK